ncbi:MAG: InlB B-repeat-containing protein, partial [Propionibacteriaceae bacterium]|nr:InlB B-repeat-containing protein [Propionibacteriaceae bacterium]
MLPTGENWKPVMTGTPYIMHTPGWEDMEIWYTTDPVLPDTSVLNSLNTATGELVTTTSLTWSQGTLTAIGSSRLDVGGISAANLANITAWKIVYKTLPIGDQINFYMPYRVDKVDYRKLSAPDCTSNCYGDVEVGDIYYWFGPNSNQIKNHQMGSAVRLLRSAVPEIREFDASALPTATQSYAYGASGLADWWKLTTFDDYTAGISAASIKVEKTPWGDGTSSVILSSSDFISDGTYSPATGADGVKGHFNITPTDYISTTSPGTYTITYTTTTDGDTQGTTATRTIFVDKPIYTVTYHADGSTSGAAPADAAGNAPTGAVVGNKYYDGSTVTTLGAGTLAKDHHFFAGWATSSGSTTVAYAAAATFTISANVDLYPVFYPNVLSVSYKVNSPVGAQADFTPANAVSGTPAYNTTGADRWVYGLAKVGPSDIPTAPHDSAGNFDYDFVGWFASEADADAITSSGVVGSAVPFSFTGNYADDLSTLTLYAAWVEPYGISYDLGGASANNAHTPARFTRNWVNGTSAIRIYNPPARTGYTFTGWTA